MIDNSVSTANLPSFISVDNNSALIKHIFDSPIKPSDATRKKLKKIDESCNYSYLFKSSPKKPFVIQVPGQPLIKLNNGSVIVREDFEKVQ
jgi:hypothetical protein